MRSLISAFVVLIGVSQVQAHSFPPEVLEWYNTPSVERDAVINAMGIANLYNRNPNFSSIKKTEDDKKEKLIYPKKKRKTVAY